MKGYEYKNSVRVIPNKESGVYKNYPYFCTVYLNEEIGGAVCNNTFDLTKELAKKLVKSLTAFIEKN